MTGRAPARAGERIEGDWIDRSLPPNLEIAATAYVESASAFMAFRSTRRPGLKLAHGAGAYGSTNFAVGPEGEVDVGEFTCLNGCELICEERIEIGAHGLISWGVVITDCWGAAQASPERRRTALKAAAGREDRWIAPVARPRPVTVEDNVWIGFDAVILPGVRLGRGCVIGARSVVDRDIPAYAVAMGDPIRIVRRLEPDDTPEARRRAMETGLAT